MTMDNHHKGQVVLVTGATSGIGLALMRVLREAGFHPVLTGRDAVKVTRLADDLGVPGYALDVAQTEHCTAVLTQVTQEVGPVWGLVNNAGVWLEGPFQDNALEDIRRVMEINTMGTINLTHAALPAMLARGDGAVVNVVSTGALYTRKGLSVYAASKWAIRGFTGCLEAECAPSGVRVMGFYPGKVDTGLYESAGVERDLGIAMTPEQAAHMIAVMLSSADVVWSQVGGRSMRDYA